MTIADAVLKEAPSNDSHLSPDPDETKRANFASSRLLQMSKGQLPILGSALVLLAVMLISLGLGKYPITVKEILLFLGQKYFGASFFPADRMRLLNSIIMEIRLPRILAGALIGAALSTTGAAFQAMFVNPLVSPSLLGVLAGASFGAALGIVYLKSWFAVQVATFLGGLLAVVISVGIASVYRINSTIMLVLGGIISGALFSSLLSLVKYLSDPYNQLPTIVNWLMGSLTLSDRSQVIKTSFPICLGLLVLLLLSRHLNVLSMGDEEARSLGVNVQRVRLIVIFCATVVSALTVVIAGTISWVGLIIPHFARMITGPDNRKLIPATILIGAAYLIVADDISRLAFSYEIPIGIVTALIGIPCFAFVLRNARKGWS
jgi:iron complex transport system permease protein